MMKSWSKGSLGGLLAALHWGCINSRTSSANLKSTMKRKQQLKEYLGHSLTPVLGRFTTHLIAGRAFPNAPTKRRSSRLQSSKGTSLLFFQIKSTKHSNPSRTFTMMHSLRKEGLCFSLSNLKNPKSRRHSTDGISLFEELRNKLSAGMSSIFLTNWTWLGLSISPLYLKSRILTKSWGHSKD